MRRAGRWSRSDVSPDTTNSPQQPNARVAIYPGSFDLLTNGHVDLINRCRRLYDRLIVAVGVNPAKTPFFSLEERIDILREVTAGMGNVEIVRLDGLTVHFAAQNDAMVIIRGLRAMSDFEFELQLALANLKLNRNIETLFMAADPKTIYLSSSMLRDIWRHGGEVSVFCPPAVVRALLKKTKPNPGEARSESQRPL
ncbi:MAG: pantetheine-phosphate adenylyltransferase [Candidatus Sumerlaeia bacterium]|nr:pantetheine-phosphate adenylyltransferase [Candidatus Sumerlaeia bacterium]